MSFTSKKKLAITAAVVGAMVLGGTSAAMAKTSETDFGGIMNKYQQSRYFVYETKSQSSTNSQIRFNAIGSDYLANVKAENRGSGTQYTEKKGLGENYTYAIENKTPAGTQTRLIVTNSEWAVVDVAIDGWFKTM